MMLRLVLVVLLFYETIRERNDRKEKRSQYPQHLFSRNQVGFLYMSISLTPELEQFIQSQIASGKYASTEDVIIAGIKLLEERERIYKGRFEELKREIAIGVEQLERGERLDGREVIEKLRQKNQAMRKAEA